MTDHAGRRRSDQDNAARRRRHDRAVTAGGVQLPVAANAVRDRRRDRGDSSATSCPCGPDRRRRQELSAPAPRSTRSRRCAGGEADLRDFLALGHSVLDRIEASPLPVVAAVQGLCLAGGIELALACDVVFAAEDARFGDQHAAFGLIPGWGGSQRLTRAVGLRRALDLMYSARWLDAAHGACSGALSIISRRPRGCATTRWPMHDCSRRAAATGSPRSSASHATPPMTASPSRTVCVANSRRACGC